MPPNDDRAALDTLDCAVLTAAERLPVLQRVAVCAAWQSVYRLISSLIDRIEKLEGKTP